MPAKKAILAACRQDDAGKDLEVAWQPLEERQQMKLEHIARLQLDPQQLEIQPARFEHAIQVICQIQIGFGENRRINGLWFR
ncbi:MAG: hypothetical protein DMG12_09395 [Acidobacteria bacterium]|nr:MAG: hypothetical protein DMG12_09395 [Acidobacteriota bacterium]